MMKIKLFTHTDLDGIGCAIVAFTTFGRENVDVTYCDYHTVDDKITEFINDKEQMEKYDKVYITDISVNEETAHGIHMMNDYYHGSHFQLLDHHEKANWLNKYDWAKVVQTHEDGSNSSGTTLILYYLEEQGCNLEGGIRDFAETVRRYDTWDWENIYKDIEPKKWNDLFYLYGRDRFIKKVYFELLTSPQMEPWLNEQDLMFLEVEQEKINRYVNKSIKSLTIKNVGKFNVGMVFGENYINEVAHEIHNEFPALDLVAVINMRSKKVSYRTQREDIDVNQFASYFGGGGRPQTAGSQISDAVFGIILDSIFGN
jgi:uncharacterized protein